MPRRRGGGSRTAETDAPSEKDAPSTKVARSKKALEPAGGPPALPDLGVVGDRSRGGEVPDRQRLMARAAANPTGRSTQPQRMAMFTTPERYP